MSTDIAYPAASAPLGILNLQPIFSPAILPAGAVTLSQLPPLDFLLLADRLAELYTMLFPEQPDWLQEEIHWVDVEDVAEAAAQFLGRVNDLFPVYQEFWEVELEDIEWPLYEIPITPYGFDLWDDDWDNFKEPIPYLLHMLYSRQAEVKPNRDNTFHQLYSEFQVPDDLAPQNLINILRQMELSGPLEGLPDLILMLEKNTGNIWLDMGAQELSENGYSFNWTRENITELPKAWQQAKPVIDRVFRLLDWQHSISRTTDGKIAAVHEALLQAYRLVPIGTEKTEEVS